MWRAYSSAPATGSYRRFGNTTRAERWLGHSLNDDRAAGLDHPKRPFGRELIRIRTFRQRSCWRCKARRSALAVYGLTSRSNISGWTGDLKGQADLAFTFGLICRE